MATPRRTHARRLLVAPAAIAALLLTPALAGASVDYVSIKARDVGTTADGVVGPGDLVALTVTAHNPNAATTATGVTARITNVTGATAVDASAALGDIGPDENGSNTSDQLLVQLPPAPAMACGDVVRLSLRLADSGSATNASANVPTGVPGSWTSRSGGGATIPDAGVGESSMTVSGAGAVRDVRVRIDDLQSPSVDDLQLRLLSPDGSPATVLPDHRIAGGTQFSGTTFATRGPSISAAAPPYTGTFLAPELAGVIGSSGSGTWTLRIADTTAGSAGTPASTLAGWTLETAEASCIPQLVARLTASAAIAAPGAGIVFDASDSTSPTVDSASLTYEWTVDGAPVLGAGSQLSQSFLQRGLHTVGVTVSDGVTTTPATDQVTVAVTDPPTASFTARPLSPRTGDVVDFDASASSDPDGTVGTYQWDFDGNGTWDLTSSAPTTPHVYSRSGTYQVRLRVTDDLGARAVATVPVTVLNRPPAAAFGPPAPAVRGAPAHFDASASADPDGAIAQYRWDWNADGTY
ncbi:MAG TPA: PKD domain-containing protein, partial [Solirubrobacteraceae bacterium]|nr:PKD domain-containing protein [Solirubrobacteraceae bacterium]